MEISNFLPPGTTAQKVKQYFRGPDQLARLLQYFYSILKACLSRIKLAAHE